MPEYFPPPPYYIITHQEVLGTALLTLPMLFSWRSAPDPPRLDCNTVGQVHHCTARGIHEFIQEQHC